MCYTPGSNSKIKNIERTSSEETVKKNLVALNMGAVVQRVESYYFWSMIYFAILVKEIF